MTRTQHQNLQIADFSWMEQYSVLPGWLLTSTANSESTLDNEDPAKPFLGTNSSPSTLTAAIQNWHHIQTKLLKGEQQQCQVAFSALSSELEPYRSTSSMREKTRNLATKSFFEELGQWKVFLPQKNSIYSTDICYESFPLFQQERILRSKSFDSRFYGCEFTGAQLILGVYHAYSELRNAQIPLALFPKSLCQDLSKNELATFLKFVCESNLSTDSALESLLPSTALIQNRSSKVNIFERAEKLSEKLIANGAASSRGRQKISSHINWKTSQTQWLWNKFDLVPSIGQNYLKTCSNFYSINFLTSSEHLQKQVEQITDSAKALETIQKYYGESHTVFHRQSRSANLHFKMSDQSMISGLDLFWELTLAKQLGQPCPPFLNKYQEHLPEKDADQGNTLSKCAQFFQQLSSDTQIQLDLEKTPDCLPIRDIQTQNLNSQEIQTDTAKNRPPKAASEPAPQMIPNQEPSLEFEIAKLRESNSPLYGECLEAYLQSLEQKSRELMLQIRSRMPQHEFSKHLEPRLVKFLATKSALVERIQKSSSPTLS